ncbi:MAG: virulence RhuM family protein, partial [Clostridiales Family XIII bacterium]|nr:virulence RhuM family protein [Clostridiales Family XIII bacterium]
IVNAYLELAESRAKRHIPMTMEDWSNRLDIFLQADDRELLKDAGKINVEIAKEHAEGEFEKYRIRQELIFENDFDKELKMLESQVDTK